MKADDLKLKELIDFADGSITLHGRRLALHSLHAFAQLRKDLTDMVGQDQTRRILCRFGYFWGEADAGAMKRIFDWDNVSEWLFAGPKLHSIQGVVQPTIKAFNIDAKKGLFKMELTWRNSGEAEEHLAVLGKSDHPSCWMLTGYASGYASFCLKKPVYFIEDKCRAKGDRICTAVGMDKASWGDTLTPHLPFFQSDDIRGKILKLTKELKNKSLQISRQRQHLASLTDQSKLPLVEIHNQQFRHVVELAARVASFDTSILITGETGTGKEVLARYIHQHSHRSKGRFVAVNCSALPETLLESELFGYKKGAFTGAIDNRIGLLEHAAKGTVFLDEIGDISPLIQTKLLRVLQEHEITRIGESTPRKIDVRVITATNRDLNKAIAQGTFREDLLYRLRVIEIQVPTLRKRTEDILPLARHFIKIFSEKLNLPKLRLDSTCVDFLLKYSWPGNVRELENALEHAAVLSPDGVIRPEYLPRNILSAGPIKVATSADPNQTLAEVEKEHINFVLKSTNGNRTQTARLLGISSTSLWRKLKNQ